MLTWEPRSVFRRYNGSLFGFTRQHQVLCDLPDADKFFAAPLHTLNSEPLASRVSQLGPAHVDLRRASIGSSLTNDPYKQSFDHLTTPTESMCTGPYSGHYGVPSGDIIGVGLSSACRQ